MFAINLIEFFFFYYLEIIDMNNVDRPIELYLSRGLYPYDCAFDLENDFILCANVYDNNTRGIKEKQKNIKLEREKQRKSMKKRKRKPKIKKWIIRRMQWIK